MSGSSIVIVMSRCPGEDSSWWSVIGRLGELGELTVVLIGSAAYAAAADRLRRRMERFAVRILEIGYRVPKGSGRIDMHEFEALLKQAGNVVSI